MTMIVDIERKCAMCGHESSQPAVMSTNSMGFPDLDTRPPEMQRSTMHVWVIECPECGYIADDISEGRDISMEFLKSDEYTTCSGIDFTSDLARKFYKKYLISTEARKTKAAFYDLLHCAWACDDKKDTENAKLVRKIASDLADIITIESKDNDMVPLIKADLLRRSGEFEKLIDEYNTVTHEDELYMQIIEFQIEKARQKDDSCYTVEDIGGEFQ